MRTFWLLLLALPGSAQWLDLIDRELTHWQVIGDGVWKVTSNGILIGQRDLTKPYKKTDPDQSWLYTKEEFGEFDLELDYWTRLGGNSGISLRDTSRARYSFGNEADPNRTPSHIGYEIQISNGYRDRYPTGSLYLFQPASGVEQNPYDWNRMTIQSRNDIIRVFVNGKLVMEHPGDPNRPKVGPVGLQLHDRQSIVMFQRIRINAAPRKSASAAPRLRLPAHLRQLQHDD